MTDILSARPSHPSPARRVGALAALLTLAALPAAHAAPADVFRQWQSDPWLTRQLTLSELGLRTPIVLDAGVQSREVFLPVPANVRIQDGTMQVNANYLRADGGRSTAVLSIDGIPVSARGLTDARGDASVVVPVDGAPRKSGFVRFGAAWSSVISDVICADQRAPGNVLRIEPTSRFTYRLDRRDLNTLATAWSALPPEPVLLVARQASAPVYDTAWRLGVVLERAGKRVQVRALPGVGDTVSTAGLQIPADLRTVPAFAGLGDNAQRHVVKDAAELGALLSLGAIGPVRADVAVVDPALQQQLAAALDAVAGQLGTDDARTAFASWRQGAFADAAQAATPRQVRLTTIGGAPVIAVAADGGSQAAALFGELWRPVANGPQITVQTASAPRADARVLLSHLGGLAGSLDVAGRADWTATFGIGDVLDDGRKPSVVVLDVSAAPDPLQEAPVATVFLNDFLLGARVLPTDGKPQRVRIPVPEHLLAARNTLRISFFRQPTKPRCHDVQTSYPVSVLPTSHLELDKFSPGDDFFAMHRRFAGGADVFVPAAWLQDAPASLLRTIRIADAAGVSPTRARLVVADGKDIAPKTAFLALDVATGGSGKVEAGGGQLKLSSKKTLMLDAGQIDRTAVLEVAELGGEHGVVYRSIGATPPSLSQPFLLGRGDVALLGTDGVLLEVNTRDPRGAVLADEANPETVWSRYAGWWLVVIAVVLLALAAARIAQIRRRKRLRRATDVAAG